MAAPVLQFKRGSSTTISSGIVSFRAGEPGFTTDKSDFYIGSDGTSNGNKFFGSSRYWNRETATVGSSVRVVEGSNNGNNFIALKSPDNLAADVTYTLPVGVSTAGYILQNDGTGILSWVPAVSSGATSGITIQDEGSIVGSASSVTTINFVGNGIVATAVGTAATITLSTATTSTLGVASFNSTNFTVTAGAVSLAANAVGLGTNTVGQYAQSLTNTGGLSITSPAADDGTQYNLSVVAGAGIAVTTDSVSFKNAASLGNNTLMKYDTGNTQLTNSIITDNGTTATVTGGLTVTGTLTGTASTATRATTADVTATNAQTGGIVFATAGNGATLYNDADLTYDSNANRLTAVNVTASTEVRTPSVKAGDGTAAITITNSTGAVGIASDLTVTGSLYVAGSTTQVNTTSLQVEDRVIELGKVQGTAPSDTTWDLGILFNYYTASANKKASVYWEGGVSRFLFASDVTESVLGINLPDTGAVGLGTTTPQLTSPTFAPIEVGALWLNDTAGSSAIASYLTGVDAPDGVSSGRYLHNITVDCGVF